MWYEPSRSGPGWLHQAEAQRLKEQKLQEAVRRKEEQARAQQRRKQQAAQFRKRTRTGQPVMKYRIDKVLEQLQSGKV
jgi:rRNA processing